MALSRRQFVQTAGIGAGAALTSSVWGRGRENSVWSAFEAELQAVEKGVICIASNENPVGPGKKVLDSLRALLEGGARPGRYSNQTGELSEAIAAHFPGGGEQGFRLARIDAQIDDAGFIIDVENFLPGFAAISGLIYSTLFIGCPKPA